MLWVLIRITHNRGFYEDLTKNIFQLSSNTHHISASGSILLDVPGRVKTLAELEADLQIGSKPGHPAGLRRMTPPNVPNQQIHPMQRSKSPEENDLTAFNKLISLMKAGAATPMESPKVPSTVKV